MSSYTFEKFQQIICLQILNIYIIQRSSLSVDDNIYASPRGLSTLAKEFTATTRIMQSSSDEMSILVSGKAKIWINENYYIMPYNSRADVVRLLVERYDTKPNAKWAEVGPSCQHLTCLATLKIYDTTKQSVCGRKKNICVCVCV